MCSNHPKNGNKMRKVIQDMKAQRYGGTNGPSYCCISCTKVTMGKRIHKISKKEKVNIGLFTLLFEVRCQMYYSTEVRHSKTSRS